METASHPLRSRIVALIALTLLTAAAVWMLARPDAGGSGVTAVSAHHHAQTSTAASGGDSASKNESPHTSPKGGVVLPEGTERVNGLETKFPDTDLGAVATQVAVSRAQIGFDYSTAIRAVETYAAPAETAVFEQRARSAVALRRKAAGVPADGEATAPAAYAVTPVAYQLQKLQADYYAVTLLSYVTLTTTGGKSKDGFYVGTQLVKWLKTDTGRDWKVTAGTQADVREVLDAHRPQPAAPGTALFKSEGWIQLNAEQS